MRRFTLLSASLLVLGGVVCVWADNAPDAAANNASVSASTEPERGMTEAPGGGIFLTLTRNAFPVGDLPTSADRITPDQFKKFNAQNAGEAIAHQTSVETLPQGGLGTVQTARIRGSTADQTQVLIDGRPMEGYALGTPDLSEIPIESIDHIEILRGGVSSLYGPNAIGGVINVITKRATYSGKPIADVGFEERSFGGQVYRLNAASRYGPLDFIFYGNQQWESGFRDNSDARSHNIGGNVGLSMGGAGKLIFDASSYHVNLGVPGLSCGPSDPNCLNGVLLMPNQFNNADEKRGSSPTARQTTDTNYIRTSYLLPLPADSLMTLRLFGMQREVLFEDAADPLFPSSSDRHEQSKGGEAQFNLPLGFMVGGSFVRDREDSTDLLTPSNTFIKSIESWGVFAQEEFHWQTLTLIPSGRFDHNSQAGDSKNPRVQLIEDALPWLRLSGSAARSFRGPTIDDLFFVSPFFNGNPGLKPETAWTYDAGFELHSDSTSLRATYFRSNITDLIQTVEVDPVNFIFGVQNVGTARRQGMELQLAHVLNEYVRNSLNYTYLENRGIPPGFDHLVPLQFSPRHTVNQVLTLKPAKRWTVDSTLRYLDSRFSNNDQTGTKLGSQLLWDLRLAYQLRQAELYLGSSDVTNKRYEEQPGFPLPGRTLFGGVTLRLWE